MNKIKLVRPSMDYAKEIMDYKNEFLECNSSMDGTGPLRRCQSAKKFIFYTRLFESPDSVPEGYVDSHQFMAVREEDHRVVGMIDFRHHINHPHLSEYGGHIGYSVRPSERKKGYAKEMLKQVLAFVKDYGLSKVLVTCYENNAASEKTILSCGGIFERNTVEPKTQKVVKRYWINLE